MDTHTAVKKLMNSGMPEKQAESVVEIQARLLDQNLVTKTDFAAIMVEISSLKSEISSIKTDMMRWVFGINLATATLLVAILKFL